MTPRAGKNPETEQARNDQKFKDDPYYRGSGADRNQDWGASPQKRSNDHARPEYTRNNDSYSTAADDLGNPTKADE